MKKKQRHRLTDGVVAHCILHKKLFYRLSRLCLCTEVRFVSCKRYKNPTHYPRVERKAFARHKSSRWTSIYHGNLVHTFPYIIRNRSRPHTITHHLCSFQRKGPCFCYWDMDQWRRFLVTQNHTHRQKNWKRMYETKDFKNATVWFGRVDIFQRPCETLPTASFRDQSFGRQ